MRKTIFRSALLLTGVNLLLRLVGTSFQVYLSRRIGAEGIGLLQLVMSVGSMAMVAGMAGARTATLYLTAEELGHGRRGSIPYVLSGCVGYSILCGTAVACGVYFLAPIIAEKWIGSPQAAGAVRLYAAFLPVNCLTGVMVGYFTGEQRIGTLAVVEVAEQLVSMTCTLGLLFLWAGSSPERCCQAVVLGGGMGACLTLISLTVLRLRERRYAPLRIRVVRRLLDTALPLAIADDFKTGINTVENLMVPKRLSLYPGVLSPLSAFGIVSGMVFPVLMFPACILYGLAELLVPEMARCAASGSNERIRYLARRSLKMALLYALLLGGLEFLLADWLCAAFYQNPEAGQQLRLYAVLIPILYCDAITDAITKGLGQQKLCVRYNILTSVLDVLFLYFLLPKYGMNGYFLSFFITHLLNFVLSLRLLLKITSLSVPAHIPILALSCAAAGAALCFTLSTPAARAAAYPVILGCLLYLMKIICREDALWLKGLITGSPQNEMPR